MVKDIYFSLRSGTKFSPLTTSVKYCIGHADQSNKARKQIKGIWNRKEEIKLLLFSDGMIIMPASQENHK